MTRHAYPPYHDHRVEDAAPPLSPLAQQQPFPGGTANGNFAAAPYPDSTASSAPSEDALHADVDEDKRKRNQAASARFRQKKKQREHAMLEATRDMQERNKRLEGEVEGLKRENTFLKKLLVEKMDNMSADDRKMFAKAVSVEE